jgi:genome maintenance exonuclease 1
MIKAKQYIHDFIPENIIPDKKGKNLNGFRFYDFDGASYPSITTVLSVQNQEGLIQWRERVGAQAADWEARRAAMRGKQLHTIVENHLNNVDNSTQIKNVLPLGLFRLMRPYLEKIDNIKLIERVLYSKHLTVAGQVDCVADYDGKLSVIDFKSSNRFKKEEYVENYFLQTTAYATMYEELIKKKVEQIVVLIAGEDGSMTEWIKDPADYKGPLVRAIKDFYDYFKKTQKKEKEK